MTDFKVVRQHYGDKQYWPGDMRQAEQRDVQHLIDGGTLEIAGEKADNKPLNKAEPRLSNKADPLDHDGNGRKGGTK